MGFWWEGLYEMEGTLLARHGGQLLLVIREERRVVWMRW